MIEAVTGVHITCYGGSTDLKDDLRRQIERTIQARVALDAIREEMTLTELSKKSGVHSGQISTWKRAALDNMTSAIQ